MLWKRQHPGLVSIQRRSLLETDELPGEIIAREVVAQKRAEKRQQNRASYE